MEISVKVMDYNEKNEAEWKGAKVMEIATKTINPI